MLTSPDPGPSSSASKPATDRKTLFVPSSLTGSETSETGWDPGRYSPFPTRNGTPASCSPSSSRRRPPPPLRQPFQPPHVRKEHQVKAPGQDNNDNDNNDKHDNRKMNNDSSNLDEAWTRTRAELKRAEEHVLTTQARYRDQIRQLRVGHDIAAEEVEGRIRDEDEEDGEESMEEGDVMIKMEVDAKMELEVSEYKGQQRERDSEWKDQQREWFEEHMREMDWVMEERVKKAGEMVKAALVRRRQARRRRSRSYDVGEKRNRVHSCEREGKKELEKSERWFRNDREQGKRRKYTDANDN